MNDNILKNISQLERDKYIFKMYVIPFLYERITNHSVFIELIYCIINDALKELPDIAFAEIDFTSITNERDVIWEIQKSDVEVTTYLEEDIHVIKKALTQEFYDDIENGYSISNIFERANNSVLVLRKLKCP